MHFLLSNDDGYQSPGLEALAASISTLGRITVVAPDRDRSAASNSLTLDTPLTVRTASNGFYYVNGTPTDCVHLAITGLLEDDPDMVISGINTGANLGDDVLYSGTVAAAMEGRFLGRPAVAVSLTNPDPAHFETAAHLVVNLIEKMLSQKLPSDLLLNINIPDLDHSELPQWEVTRLGKRHKSEASVKMNDPKGREVYWIGPAGPGNDVGPGTDFNAIKNGNISVTPLQFDLTRYDALEDVSAWMTS
ncbi:MAG: 5'/3'-nucleotidase SurE [Gammaproteobacteria bacterium]